MTSLYSELHDPEPVFCTRCGFKHQRYWCPPPAEESDKDNSEEEE